jgi:hypothetical protein
MKTSGKIKIPKKNIKITPINNILEETPHIQECEDVDEDVDEEIAEELKELEVQEDEKETNTSLNKE